MGIKFLVATSNRGKLRELQALLPEDIELVTLADVELESPQETGATFTENARIKTHSALRAGLPVLAEDAGLEVDALGGLPGVRSARYAGPDATDDQNNARLLADLESVPLEERTARFRSVVALALPTGQEFVAEGTIEGVIVTCPRGDNGFGYDPLFEIADERSGRLNGMTAAELTAEDKNQISHRARAYRALLRQIHEESPEDPVLQALLGEANDE